MTTETAGVTHRTIDANGIKMHIAEAGEGPLVLLLHGFPESWYSWRHQIPALAAAGYHVVAPDQRGYGRTDKPPEIDAYDLVTWPATRPAADAFGEEPRWWSGTTGGRSSPGTPRCSTPIACAASRDERSLRGSRPGPPLTRCSGCSQRLLSTSRLPGARRRRGRAQADMRKSLRSFHRLCVRRPRRAGNFMPKPAELRLPRGTPDREKPPAG